MSDDVQICAIRPQPKRYPNSAHELAPRYARYRKQEGSRYQSQIEIDELFLLALPAIDFSDLIEHFRSCSECRAIGNDLSYRDGQSFRIGFICDNPDAVFG